MALVTLIILIALTCFTYRYYIKDYLGPAFLLNALFLAAYFVVLLNYQNWEVIIYPKFTLCITCGLLAWWFGSFIYRLLTGKPLNFSNFYCNNDSLLLVRQRLGYPYIQFSILSLFLTVIYLYIHLRNINIGSLTNTLRYIYDNNSGDSEGPIISNILEIIVALGYINTHRILLEKYIDDNKKINTKLLPPIIFFLICTLVSTDRNILLRYVIFIVGLYILFYRTHNENTNINVKLIKRIILIVFIGALAFWAYGKAKNYTSNLTRAIGLYSGAGLYDFNLWLKDFQGPFLHGENTFSTVKETLKALGIGKGSNYNWNLEFIRFYSKNGYIYDSNIYCALRYYYEDFGMAGIIIIPMIQGFFYELLYYNCLKTNYGLGWLLYCSYLYPIVYYPLLEMFIKRFHFGLVYEIFWLVFFFKLLYGKNGLWKYRIRWRSY